MASGDGAPFIRAAASLARTTRRSRSVTTTPTGNRSTVAWSSRFWSATSRAARRWAASASRWGVTSWSNPTRPMTSPSAPTSGTLDDEYVRAWPLTTTSLS